MVRNSFIVLNMYKDYGFAGLFNIKDTGTDTGIIKHTAGSIF